MAGIKGQATPGQPNIKDYGFGGKYRTKKQDDEYRSRIKGVPKKRLWTKDKIHDFLDEMLTKYKKILIDDEKINKGNKQKLKAETVRDMNNIMNRMLQFMEKFYPPVQKNVNLNIDVTANAVLDRLENWKKEQVVVIGESAPDLSHLKVQIKPEEEELEEQPVD